jgi:hypothetical protein
VRAYSAWHIVGVDATDILEASELQDRLHLSFWDALIVTAALKVNADVLFTEDLAPEDPDPRPRGSESVCQRCRMNAAHPLSDRG